MVHKIGPRPNVVKQLYGDMKTMATVNDAYYPEIIQAMHLLTMFIVNQMGQTIDKYEPCEVCPPDTKQKIRRRK